MSDLQAQRDGVIHRASADSWYGRAPSASIPHISACVCTYKRPELLSRLLSSLAAQETLDLFTLSVVVVDNDNSQSARNVATHFARTESLDVSYFVEPVRNIALARNMAIAHSRGEYLAFVDDDEDPNPRWLASLLDACMVYSVDGVLGPVLPRFEQEPPDWVVQGRFFERESHECGFRVRPADMRTGNVILRRASLVGVEGPFRAEFGTGGEDVDFFSRMIAKGCEFTWCKHAIVSEHVPVSRCNRRYLLRRALLRGGNSFKLQSLRGRRVAKSFVALPAYLMALPVLFVAGHHHFIKYLVKICDHAGRLLASVGVTPLSERDP